MRVAIIGAGSIGAVLGAKLAASGHEVVLVARGAHLAALRERGLTLIDHVGGASGTYRLPVSDEPADFEPQDLVIIGLKAHAIPAMLPRMAPLVGRATVVVPAINGLPWWYFQGVGGDFDGLSLRALDPDDTMCDALDASHLVGCVVHIAAEVRAPGEAHHTGGRRLILGELDNSASVRLNRVCDALDAAGFDTVRSTNIRLDVWTKLIGNLSFNPIAALTGYLMNQIVADERVLDVIRPMMVEAMRVAEHVGIRVSMTPDQRIDLARQLGAVKISMLQDLEQRRRLELDAIVGSVIELAERAGIDVPTVRHVHALAHARAKALGID
ncbi:MAG: ketopantoate reductase family protein [Burkholderiaceae bacterium]